MILGLLAALLTALLQSATDIFTKLATRSAQESAIVAAQWVSGAALLCGLCIARHPDLLSHPAATLAALSRPDFAPLLFLSGALNLIAYALYVRAFHLSEASLVAPLVLLTPMLMLITSPLMLHEHTSALGAVGVVLTVLGAGFLNGGAGRRLSFVALWRDRGARLMLATATIWSVTANLDKLGLRASTPLVWITAVTCVIALGAVIHWTASPRRKTRLKDLRFAIAAGAANAVGNAVQMSALAVLQAPYVIAIKRTSALYTILLSGMLLEEKAQGRVIAATIMLAGALLIVCAGA
jgi:uncharacterized membrane protein